MHACVAWVAFTLVVVVSVDALAVDARVRFTLVDVLQKNIRVRVRQRNATSIIVILISDTIAEAIRICFD